MRGGQAHPDQGIDFAFRQVLEVIRHHTWPAEGFLIAAACTIISGPGRQGSHAFHAERVECRWGGIVHGVIGRDEAQATRSPAEIEMPPAWRKGRQLPLPLKAPLLG